MIRRPPRSTRTDTLFPYTTLFRSVTGFFSDHFGRRGLEPMREAFAHLAANRGAYDNLQSLAEMAIIYSRYSQDNIDGIGSEVAYLDYFRGDRKSVVEGKSVSVRVDRGGRRIITKKHRTKRHDTRLRITT